MCASGEAVVVFKEEGSESAAHVPLEVVGEHAEEDMGADVLRGIDEDGAYLDEAFDGAEGMLDAGEAFVGGDGGVAGDGGFVEAGADDVDAVELGFGGDAVEAPGPGEFLVGDGDIEVLLDLLAVGVPSDAAVDGVFPAEAAGSDGGGDVLEELFGVAEEGFAFSGALLAESGVETDEEALAGEVGAGDLGDGVGEEFSGAQGWGLVGFRLEELADPLGVQGGDPVEAGGLEILADPGGGEHAAVADEGHLFDAEPAADRSDLCGDGGGVGGVAGEDLDRHRTAVGSTEEAEDQLLAVLLAVAAVAEAGEGAVTAFEIAGGDVVEDHGAALEVAVGEALLDPGLAAQEPVEHGEDFVAVDVAEAEEGAEAGVGGVGGEAAGGGEFGIGCVETGGDGGEGEVPHAAGVAVEDAREAELLAGAEDGGDVPVGEGAAECDGAFEALEGHPAADDGADAVDESGGQFGEVGKGAPSDALSLAPGLSEEDGGGALTVRDGVDVEGH